MKYENNIRRMREARGDAIGRPITQQELADTAGLTKGFISLLESGQRQLVQATAQKIASALNCQVQELYAAQKGREIQSEHAQNRDDGTMLYGTTDSRISDSQSEKITLQTLRVTHTVPLLGKVEAGTWREMDGDGGTLGTVTVDDPEFIGIKFFGYVVSGTSMNKVFPDGAELICYSPYDAPLKNGQYVILRRTNKGLVETTCKQLEVGHDGTWRFWPRSTDERHQQPLVAPPRDEMQQEGWEIIAIVRRWVPAPFEYHGEPVDFNVTPAQ